MLERFRKTKEPAPKMVPGNMTAMIFDACGVRPEPYTKCANFPDDYPEWITEEEEARRMAASPTMEETVEELRKDPDVAAILEAYELGFADIAD